jgi:hypothetical protein
VFSLEELVEILEQLAHYEETVPWFFPNLQEIKNELETVEVEQ